VSCVRRAGLRLCPPQEPLSIEETAERHVRPALRAAFVDLCRGSVADYLSRFGFKSDLLKVMYAVSRHGVCGAGWGRGVHGGVWVVGVGAGWG
jgi:hypothetical protein